MDLIGAWIADNSWLLILFTALSVVLMLVATDKDANMEMVKSFFHQIW